MLCPNCNSTLQDTTALTKSEQQGVVSECFTCGGHWFPRWLANDISLSTAISLDAVITHQSPAPNPNPRCPLCQTRLSLISHDSVAKGTSVFACPQGHGNFFPQGQLKSFKQAQEAKITYHELWGIPIKSIFAVLLPVLAVLGITAGIPITMRQLQQSQENRTQASEEVSRPIISILSPTSALLSFSTKTPTTSSLKLYQNDQLINTLPVSTTQATHHQITLTDLSVSSNYSFSLVVITSTQTITTPITPLNFK